MKLNMNSSDSGSNIHQHVPAQHMQGELGERHPEKNYKLRAANKLRPLG